MTNLTRCGFQKLVLLNSAGYSRAELPLDHSVSLIAPNNTGKTSLINALQFLLIIDKRNMDFGAYSFETSKKFYFPSNSSYILLEVLLPSGMVVIACVGKGLSHDYQYFIYRGQLNVNDYRLMDNQLVTETQLRQQLQKNAKTAKYYLSSELKALLYGSKPKHNDFNLTVFPLEKPNLAGTYQRILTRTLRLDKLSSKEVKTYLLEINQHEFTDYNIDFKSEWTAAFSDVNRDKIRFDAVTRMKVSIEKLAHIYEKLKTLRGQLIVQRPLLEEVLGNYENYYNNSLQKLINLNTELKQQEDELYQRTKAISREHAQIEQNLISLEIIEKRHIDLQLKFVMIHHETQLTQILHTLKTQYDQIASELIQARQRSIKSIEIELHDKQKQLRLAQNQLENLHDNFYLFLQNNLSADSFTILSRLLNRSTLSLAINQPHGVVVTNEIIFKQTAEKIQAQVAQQQLNFAGLHIDSTQLHCELVVKNAEELQQDINEIEQCIAQLQQLLNTTNELAKKNYDKRQLEQKIEYAKHDIKDYQEFLLLENTQVTRQQESERYNQRLYELADEEQSIGYKREQYAEQKAQVQIQQVELNTQYQRIKHARDNRLDNNDRSDYLKNLPHYLYSLNFSINMELLDSEVECYNRDYAQLLKIETQLEKGLHELHREGITQFQYYDRAEQELNSIFNFTTQLAQEKVAIDNKAHSAVIHIAALLHELNRSLTVVKQRMAEFNRFINKRQLSDLSVFKIEAREDEHLVNAIQTLISTSDSLRSGESFDLFNQKTLLDDKKINDAKDILIQCSSLQIKDLFHLVFILAKDKQPAKEYAEIDSAASNGTVLMAKLVTGLALLNLMQDKHKLIHKACYLDEAASLDQRNQRHLIATAKELGFSLIFASPEAQMSAYYCIPIRTIAGKNQISYKDWQIIKSL